MALTTLERCSIPCPFKVVLLDYTGTDGYHHTPYLVAKFAVKVDAIAYANHRSLTIPDGKNHAFEVIGQ